MNKKRHGLQIRASGGKINDPASLGTDLFGMELAYDKGLSGLDSIKQYNGNISAIKWQTTTITGQKGYTFRYDSINRLRQAIFNEYASSWSANDKYSEKNIFYDPNGNILKLTRNGLLSPNKTPGVIDNLTYYYKGNQLIGVNDAVTGGNYGDFSDNGMTSVPVAADTNTWEYRYDKNGNLTKDVNKGISGIQYNRLNLPVLINFPLNNKIEYTYNAAGSKLRKQVYTNGLITSKTDYVGNFVYENNALSYMLFEEGRIIFTGTLQAEYYLKDHLGNVRVAFTPAGVVRQVNSYYPFGMNISGLTDSPVPTTKNKYLYNGKEMQDEFGLNWLDYGARFYDGVLGRWHSVDPLAENGRKWSPNCYTFDNPIRFVDPDGMWPGPGFLTDTWNSAKSSFAGYYKSAYNTVRHPINTAKRIVNAVSNMSAKEILTAPVRMSPGYQIIKAEVTAVKAVVNGDGKTLGAVIGNQVANTTAVLATAAVGKGIAAIKGPPINNPVPSAVSRVVPTENVSNTLGPPSASDVFVTGASDIKGLNSAQISNTLTIPESSSGFTIYTFSTPNGISTPINRTNPGFIGFGKTAGGAREFTIPNQPIPTDATITTTK